MHITLLLTCIFVNIIGQDACGEKSFGTENFKGVYLVTETRIATTVFLPCVYNSEQNASIACQLQNEGGKLSWGGPNLRNCDTRYESTAKLLQLQEKNVCTVRNGSKCLDVASYISELRDIVVNYRINAVEDLVLVTSMIQSQIDPGIANILGQGINGIRQLGGIMKDAFDIVEVVLSLPMSTVSFAQVQSGSSMIIVNFLEDLATGYIQLLQLAANNNVTSVSQAITLTGNNLALSVRRWRNRSATIISKQIANTTVIEITNDTKINMTSDINSCITIPGEAINDNEYVYSYFYKNPLFFMSEQALQRGVGNTTLRTRAVQSNVLSAKVGGRKIANLTVPVLMTFKKSRSQNLEGNNICDFWDFNITTSIPGVSGNWISDGCKPSKQQTSPDFFSCECDHLTNFALLLDVHGTAEDSLELSIVTWVGCGLSLAGLFITILSFIIFKTYKRRLPQKIILSLSISLMALLIVFLAGITETSDKTGCKIVGALLHYFMLTSFLWMGVQAIGLYRSFVLVFNSKKDGGIFFVRACAVAWGVPGVVVFVTAGIAHDEYANNDVCMVTGPLFYATVVAPIVSILLCNMVVLVMVLRVVHKSLNSPDKTQSASNLRTVRIGFSCNVLLGITWLFALLAIEDASLVFQWLFCIFNSLQGFFIFILYGCRDSNLRTKWKTTLSRRSKNVTSSTDSREKRYSQGTNVSYADSVTNDLPSSKEVDTPTKQQNGNRFNFNEILLKVR